MPTADPLPIAADDLAELRRWARSSQLPAVLVQRARILLLAAGGVSNTEIAPLIKTPSSSSFPSGHSATAAAGALTLSVLYPPFAPALVLAGVLVVLSRVYLGVHFPFDVLAGVIIGTVTAGVVLVGASLVA